MNKSDEIWNSANLTFGEVVAAVAVVLADVPREKNRQRFESLKGLNAGGLLACVAGVERGWG